ncbi:hypothetical protein BDV39DRAFT_169029 [Aspergillus sergii]|uniref:Uncharacterized protein n=1 Tax=Aspergillus sergii TaxID=1034303 RepID=A0A5N6XHV9_9EURO|nr:hypothetical protein BDV39DRAFT_169029 [Aspergillus sergii]
MLFLSHPKKTKLTKDVNKKEYNGPANPKNQHESPHASQPPHDASRRPRHRRQPGHTSPDSHRRTQSDHRACYRNKHHL